MWILVVIALAVAQTGCVRRRMTIRSNPPGALVYVDDYEIGTTPVSHNFTYYGTRKIRLVKDGYETLTVMQPIPPPWYQIVPIDFVVENLVPGEFSDRRVLSYNLVPQVVVPTDQLLGRAEELRGRARSTGIVWTSPSPTGTLPPQPDAVPPPALAPDSSGGMSVHPLPPGSWPTPMGR
jgi:hypothetical protein